MNKRQNPYHFSLGQDDHRLLQRHVKRTWLASKSHAKWILPNPLIVENDEETSTDFAHDRMINLGITGTLILGHSLELHPGEVISSRFASSGIFVKTLTQ